MEQNWTSGGVFKSIVRFSLPYLASYFLQTLYGMADLFIVGQFGTVADTTAVSIGSQAMHMLTVMIVGLAMGATVMISRQTGARNSAGAAKAAGNAVSIFMLMSAVLTAVLLLLAGQIVRALATPGEAAAGTVRYLTVCFMGIPFITAYNVISSIFRGLGDTKSPMYFVAVACVLNIALDYLFIGMLGLGPLGASLGTTLSQTVSVAVSLAVILRRKDGIRLKKSDFVLEKATAADILKVGVPVAVQDGFIQVAFIVITVFANRRGLDDSAAVGIVEKCIGVLFLVPSSMLSAVSALCAQNIGAGKQERARRTLLYAAAVSAVYGAAVSVIVFFAAQQVVSVFTRNSRVVLLGGQYLRGYIWDCIFAGVHFCFSGYFCACQKSYLSFMHNALSIVLVRIPCSYIAARLFADTLFPMGLAAPLGSLLSVIVCLSAFAVLRKKGAC